MSSPHMLAEFHEQDLARPEVCISSCHWAECSGDLLAHSAQSQTRVGSPHKLVGFLGMVAVGLAEVLDFGQGHVADSWTDKPAAVKICD